MSGHGSFQTVLGAAKVGEQWAWERLVSAVNPVLRGYLRAQGVLDVDNMVGDVWLGTVKSLRSFEGDESAFRTWIISIAYRRLTDERRSASRRPRVDLEESHFELACGSHESAEATALRLGEDHAVIAALDQLTPDQRQVVSLRFLAGMSPAEVSSAMGRSTNAVHVLQNRALKRLEKILHEGRK